MHLLYVFNTLKISTKLLSLLHTLFQALNYYLQNTFIIFPRILRAGECISVIIFTLQGLSQPGHLCWKSDWVCLENRNTPDFVFIMENVWIMRPEWSQEGAMSAICYESCYKQARMWFMVNIFRWKWFISFWTPHLKRFCISCAVPLGAGSWFCNSNLTARDRKIQILEQLPCC